MPDKPPTHLAVPIQHMELVRHLLTKLPGGDEEALTSLLFPSRPNIVLPITVEPDPPAPTT